MYEIRARPFLRWVGGKSRLVRRLLKFIPRDFKSYWEPFLGAGALFFALGPNNAYISDLNRDLIECYKCVRAKPGLVHRYLRQHLSRTSESYYYKVREAYKSGGYSAAQAARFIYLNKTSFNGIYRVNLDGEFNVPYGHKEPPKLPTLQELKLAARLLSYTKISAGGYGQILNQENGPEEGDLIYLDPPYPPLNGTSFFRHYTSDRFSIEDHIKVAEVANKLRDRGCFVIVSNADLPSIRGLFQEWFFYPLPVVRWVAANGSRHKAAELVITNYDV